MSFVPGNSKFIKFDALAVAAVDKHLSANCGATPEDITEINIALFKLAQKDNAADRTASGFRKLMRAANFLELDPRITAAVTAVLATVCNDATGQPYAKTTDLVKALDRIEYSANEFHQMVPILRRPAVPVGITLFPGRAFSVLEVDVKADTNPAEAVADILHASDLSSRLANICGDELPTVPTFGIKLQ